MSGELRFVETDNVIPYDPMLFIETEGAQLTEEEYTEQLLRIKELNTTGDDAEIEAVHRRMFGEKNIAIEKKLEDIKNGIQLVYYEKAERLFHDEDEDEIPKEEEIRRKKVLVLWDILYTAATHLGIEENIPGFIEYAGQLMDALHGFNDENPTVYNFLDAYIGGENGCGDVHTYLKRYFNLEENASEFFKYYVDKLLRAHGFYPMNDGKKPIRAIRSIIDLVVGEGMEVDDGEGMEVDDGEGMEVDDVDVEMDLDFDDFDDVDAEVANVNPLEKVASERSIKEPFYVDYVDFANKLLIHKGSSTTYNYFLDKNSETKMRELLAPKSNKFNEDFWSGFQIMMELEAQKNDDTLQDETRNFEATQNIFESSDLFNQSVNKYKYRAELLKVVANKRASSENDYLFYELGVNSNMKESNYGTLDDEKIQKNAEKNLSQLWGKLNEDEKNELTNLLKLLIEIRTDETEEQLEQIEKDELDQSKFIVPDALLNRYEGDMERLEAAEARLAILPKKGEDASAERERNEAIVAQFANHGFLDILSGMQQRLSGVLSRESFCPLPKIVQKEPPTWFEYTLMKNDRHIISGNQWAMPHGSTDQSRFFYLQRKFLLQMDGAEVVEDNRENLPSANDYGLRKRKEEESVVVSDERLPPSMMAVKKLRGVKKSFEPGAFEGEDDEQQLSMLSKYKDVEADNANLTGKSITELWAKILNLHWQKGIMPFVGNDMNNLTKEMAEEYMKTIFKHSVYFLDPLWAFVKRNVERDKIWRNEEKEIYRMLEGYCKDEEGMEVVTLGVLNLDENVEELDEFFERHQKFSLWKETVISSLSTWNSELSNILSELMGQELFLFEDCRTESALKMEAKLLRALNKNFLLNYSFVAESLKGVHEKALPDFHSSIADDEEKEEEIEGILYPVQTAQNGHRASVLLEGRATGHDREETDKINAEYMKNMKRGEASCLQIMEFECPWRGTNQVIPMVYNKEHIDNMCSPSKKRKLAETTANFDKFQALLAKRAKRPKRALIAAVAAGMRRTNALSLRDKVRDSMAREKSRRELGTSLVSDVDVTEASFDAMARLDSGVRYTFPAIGSRVYVLERPVPGEEVYTLRAEDNEGVFVAGARGRTTAVAVVDEDMRAASESSDLGLAGVIGAAVAIGHCGEKGCDVACCEEMEMGIGCSCGEEVSDEAAGVIGDAYAANKDDATIADMIDLDAGEGAEGAAAIGGNIVSIHDLVSV